MIHYIIDETGDVFGYNKPGSRAMTDDEFQAFKNRQTPEEKIALEEQSWVVESLLWCDYQLMLTKELSKRAKYSELGLISHKELLRDYVTNDNGELKVNGSRPNVDSIEVL